MYSFSDVLIVISSVLFIVLIRLIILDNAKAVINVYQRPSNFYWLKVSFMYFILKIKHFKSQRTERKRSRIETFKDFIQLEMPQQLSYHKNAIDAVYFNAADNNGNHLLVSTARRKNKLVDGFVYLKIKDSDLGLLESPKLPSTSLFQTNDEQDKYEVEGIKVQPIEPMKKWKIIYEGKMKRFENRNETVDVKINAVWSSFLPHFNFDDHMDPLLMAKAMARETWSKEYFDTLKAIHQTHYEQHGDITGTVEIGSETYSIHMNSLRDHSFGTQRDWRYLHRYGLHYLTTENGDRITVGAVCMPIAFSCLNVGYIYVAKDKKIYPVQDSDLQLYQHGEDGLPPLDYAFSFTANDKRYTIQVNVVDSPVFYLSQDWESRVVERLCKFEVNGKKGWGAAGWQYRNIKGKNVPDFDAVAK